MLFEDIEKLLLRDLSSILQALYPEGKIRGKQFEIGDVGGSKGNSLQIRLSDGVWSDFAMSGSKTSGKIFKFFAHRHGGDFKLGMDEIRQLLKLPPPIPENKYKRPKKDWDASINWDSDHIQYLLKDRGLTKHILSACKVRSNSRGYIFTGRDEEGEICYAQYIARVGDDKKVVFSKNSKLCLWGMHSMTELNNSDSVVITEGVIDAMTFRMAEIYAVSIPSGIDNTDWIKHSWNWLQQFSTVYLCLDWDSAGQDKLQEIASRLGIHKCKRVVLPAKDANEVLKSAKEKYSQLLKHALDTARDIAPPKRLTARDAKELISDYVREGPMQDRGDLLFGWDFSNESYKKAINFRFRPNEQTLWTGYTGGGKTTALFQLAAYNMFVLNQTVAIASLEEPFEKAILTIMTQALGFHPDVDSEVYNKAYDYIQDRLVIFNELGNTTVEEVLEFFEYSVKKDGASHCILDSLTCTDIDLDGDRTRVNKFIQKIIDATNRSGAHYHVVAHPTKGNDEDYKEMPHVYSIKGIQEIVARAHNVIIVWRNKARDGSIENYMKNKNQPDEARRLKETVGDTIIKVAKNRNGKTTGQIHAWFDMDNSRFRPQFGSWSDRAYFSLEDKDTR